MSDASPTVLVVEDERDLADLYATWLADGYRVRTAYDGESALERLDPSVDVVLLDRRLPGMAGDEVLGRIREAGGDQRVAMVTAVEPDVDLLKLDVDEYVTKPIDREGLHDVVAEMVTRGSYERDVRRYLSLASRKRALEAERSAAELRGDARYAALTRELSALRAGLDDRLGRLAAGGADPYLPYHRRRVIADLAAVGLLAGLLVLVHVAAPSLPAAGAVGAYLATFVHLTDAHLYGNLAGYLLAAPASYLLAARIRAVGWFYATSALLLTVLPLGAGPLSLAVFAALYPGATVEVAGFSTVVAGYVGFAFLALLLAARTLYPRRTVFFVGAFVALATAAVVLAAADRPRLAAAGVPALLALAVVVRDVRGVVSGAERPGVRLAEHLAVVVSAAAFFALFGLQLFPTVGFSAGGGPLRTSVFDHLLGVLGGFGLAFAAAGALDLFPVRERLRRTGRSLPERLV